jgi:hypothetical protein
VASIPVSLALPELIAPLAPLRTGLTSIPSPVLYWYSSAPWDGEYEFTLNAANQIEPVLELTLGLPEAQDQHPAGIQGLDLAEYGVQLSPDTEYEWFVSIVPDELERSADLIASGTLRYQPLTQTIAQSYQSYAAAGYWYDAVALLSAAIAKAPDNTELRQARAALMEQAGMPKVAQFDRE